MNNESLPHKVRLAYHEVGHAVMAIEKQIEVYELTIPSRKNMRKSRFAMLGELHNLRSPHWPDLCRAVDRYVLFRLAGPAAEWTRLEKHHALAPGSDEQIRLRDRFRGERVFKSQVDFDASYAFLTAWMFAENGAEVNQLVDRYWLQACDAWGYGLMWAKVEQIARALLANGSLMREEVHSLYGESFSSLS